ncbi:MAG: type II toxin-antitoxin system VapB family antitoxin [Thermomicrobiales bacterium]
MALQISNPRIIRLVTEVSERTGEDAEAVIETALLERLERLPQPPRAADEEHLDAAKKERRERVYALVRDMQRRYKASGVTLPDHADLLYDEDGLPRTDVDENVRRARAYAAVRELQDAFQKYPEAKIDHAELLYGEDGLPK